MKAILNVINFFWTLWFHRRIIRQQMDELTKPFDLRLAEMKARHDGYEVKVEGEAFSMVSGIFIKALKNQGAKNYVVVTMRDGCDLYEVTIQRKEGETPMDQLTKARKRIAELERLQKLIKP